jgi:Leucine-rich repeat (LRR) protein
VHLDVSGGHLQSLEGLQRLSSLRTLVVDNNDLDHLPLDCRIQSLRTFSANHNAFAELAPLLLRLEANFPELAFLSLLGNPCGDSEVYVPSRSAATTSQLSSRQRLWQCTLHSVLTSSRHYVTTSLRYYVLKWGIDTMPCHVGTQRYTQLPCKHPRTALIVAINQPPYL